MPHIIIPLFAKLKAINFAALSLIIKGGCSMEDTRWALKQQEECNKQ